MLPDPLLMPLPVIDDYFFLLPIQEAHLLLREQLCHDHPCEGLGDGPDLEDCLLARLFPPLWDGKAVREHVYLAVVIGGLYSYFFVNNRLKRVPIHVCTRTMHGFIPSSTISLVADFTPSGMGTMGSVCP